MTNQDVQCLGMDKLGRRQYYHAQNIALQNIALQNTALQNIAHRISQFYDRDFHRPALFKNVIGAYFLGLGVDLEG